MSLHAQGPELLQQRKEGPLGHTRFHKLEFPSFDGTSDPLPFLNRCEHYFRGQRTLEEEQVWLAALHLQGSAQQWYMRLEREEGVPSWRRFSTLLDMRFGPPIRSNPLGEFAACRHSGSVADYQEWFLALLTRAGPLLESQQVQLFIAGLGEPLSIDVQLQGPNSLEVAMSLARACPERRDASTTGPARRFDSAGTVTVAGRTVRRLSPAELEERRRNGQCFNCDEKYVCGHNRVCARLFVMEVESRDDDDGLEETDVEKSLQISLLAIAGVRTRDTMQLNIQLGRITVIALLDSGSTHNFVSQAAARHTGLCFIPRTDLAVTVTNGDRVRCPGVFRDATFAIDNEPFRADVYVLPLGGYDMVLGTDWLATLGPILSDFGRHTMSLWRSNRRVRWRSVLGPPGARLQSLQGRELLDLLLDEFTNVATPVGLPPKRARDHSIHLMPGTPPVAVRPYRYQQLQKDELERQCRAMEKQGLIRRSSSPFSAPVLLVRKADGTWRLCVNYRALNERMVKG
ncbi:uncharacterized protein LOC120695086 [Panicum virgatum]|uniref:uncharacterized protein LOC120695086 n=1 Tax=Panicum virgatum TaxID=38727 RepID=UPI0019D5E98F|nr:uncharacterized protein LOC120695086 [Panicum virgatum]